MCTFYEKRPELVKQYDELQRTFTDSWKRIRELESKRNIFKVRFAAKKPVIDLLDSKDILSLQEGYNKAMRNFDNLIQDYKDIEIRALLLMASFDKNRLN